VNSRDTPAVPLAISAERTIEFPLIGRGSAESMSGLAMTLAALLHVAVPLLFLLHWPAPMPIVLPKPIPVALVMLPPPQAPPPPAPPAPKEPPKLPFLESGPDQQTTAPPPAETKAPEPATPRAEAQATEEPHVDAAPAAAEAAPSAKAAPAESKAKPKPHKEIAHLEPAPKETLKPQAQSLAPPPRHANIRLGDKNESGDPYLNRVMESIEAHRIYPRVMGQLGLLVEGTTVYGVLVDRSGAILEMRLQHSSGTAGIDSAAESMIRSSGPFPPIPPGYPDRLPLQVTLHLVPPE
jgi:TonB family protein